jgi:hypothetical protein
MANFDGTPLVGGSILGIRVWDLRTDGRLYSPYQDYKWVDGENVSACEYRGDQYVEPEYLPRSVVKEILYEHYLPEGSEVTSMSAEKSSNSGRWGLNYEFTVTTDLIGNFSNFFKEDKRPQLKNIEYTDTGFTGADWQQWSDITKYAEKVLVTHDHEQCSCGFYAYKDIESEEDNGNYLYKCQGVGLRGVLEGFGVVSMGPYGFRAEKSRIVALCVSTHRKESRKVNLRDLSEKYPNTFFFDTVESMLNEFPLGVKSLV